MSSIYDSSFDTNSLEKEMKDALEADRKYKSTDAMKKKAISKANSYEEFKNFVACADLKPLTQKEIQTLHPSNRTILRCRYKKSHTAIPAIRAQFTTTTPTTIPSNTMEFMRNWKRNCKETQQKFK